MPSPQTDQVTYESSQCDTGKLWLALPVIGIRNLKSPLAGPWPHRQMTPGLKKRAETGSQLPARARRVTLVSDHLGGPRETRGGRDSSARTSSLVFVLLGSFSRTSAGCREPLLLSLCLWVLFLRLAESHLVSTAASVLLHQLPLALMGSLGATLLIICPLPL